MAFKWYSVSIKEPRKYPPRHYTTSLRKEQRMNRGFWVVYTFWILTVGYLSYCCLHISLTQSDHCLLISGINETFSHKELLLIGYFLLFFFHSIKALTVIQHSPHQRVVCLYHSWLCHSDSCTNCKSIWVFPFIYLCMSCILKQMPSVSQHVRWIFNENHCRSWLRLFPCFSRRC